MMYSITEAEADAIYNSMRARKQALINRARKGDKTVKQELQHLNTLLSTWYS